ncbi:PREDICTED: glutamate-rich protein 3-like, partial [Pterocles gutturalis]|uniref:glutamate-rich protein 3-like n=1 Tax=Pterocles gutturalis TaxID=240206 RepID=UPI000528D132
WDSPEDQWKMPSPCAPHTHRLAQEVVTGSVLWWLENPLIAHHRGHLDLQVVTVVDVLLISTGPKSLPLLRRLHCEETVAKPTSWRPNTAPGNMQHLLRLEPLRSGAAGGSVPKTSSSKQQCHALEHDQQLAGGRERSGLRPMKSMEYVTGLSPYQLPIINNYVKPVPPPPLQKGDKSVNATRNGVPRGRRFRSTTAPNGAEQLLVKNSGGFPRPSLRSNAFVTMVFLGKSVHLSHDGADYRDEIKVYQQHCGGENLCVYKGRLLEGETFQFVSKRHRGFPFSLTFFLNGIQVDRLSCCCEYKHQKRSRLGGRHRYFGFLSVEGASPCYRCIIAMGLDKTLSPPKRKVDREEKPVGSWRDGAPSEPGKGGAERKSSKDSVVVILPGHEAGVETVEGKRETGQEDRGEEGKKLSDGESEDSQEDAGRTEYEEDFEADEEVTEEGQTSDQVNGMSKSPSDGKTHNSDCEKESKTSPQKARLASASEEDERDGYSNSDSEDDKQDCKPVQEEIAEATGNDNPVNSEPEPGDSCANEEEENVASNVMYDASEAAGGAFLAEGRRTLGVQKAAEHVAREGQVAGEKEDVVAAGGDAHTEGAGGGMARAGDALPEEQTVAVVPAEGPLAVEESAPGESTVAEEDHKGKGTGRGTEPGAEVAPGEQEALLEGTESE